ncbi:ATP-binding protein, partial [Streptomyces sp. NPDC014773]
ALNTHHIGDVITPLSATIDFIALLIRIVHIVWGPALTIGPFLALLALWSVGRKQQAAPAWALPANVRSGEGEPITPSIVVKALRDLGVPALRNAIKDMGDAGASMLGPIRIAGCGVEVDVTLPSGVSTIEVQNRRRKLAENLTRHEHEVFITIPTAARTVRLWIADSGALDEPIGPSPLVTDDTLVADYAKGKAPWGQDLRGDAASLSLYQRHLLITGLSNQGKTAALRALVLWLALDRTVEFRIADLKGAGDWAMFDGLATVLIQGPTDDHVIEATEMVEGGVEEMERRLTAPAGTDFPPLILLVDEAQVAFMCPVKDADKRPYGGSKATSRYFMAARKIHNQGRAVNVLLWQGTQDPTDQNLPKLVREGAHTRASLALGTESQARMALGDKAVDGGAAPNLLRPGLDKGTVIVASDGIAIPAGQSSITVRTHYIDTDTAAE